jgi:hypothetical protein
MPEITQPRRIRPRSSLSLVHQVMSSRTRAHDETIEEGRLDGPKKPGLPAAILLLPGAHPNRHARSPCAVSRVSRPPVCMLDYRRTIAHFFFFLHWSIASSNAPAECARAQACNTRVGAGNRAFPRARPVLFRPQGEMNIQAAHMHRMRRISRSHTAPCPVRFALSHDTERRLCSYSCRRTWTPSPSPSRP